MRAPRDTRTLDLLTWEPPPMVAACPEDLIRAESLRGRLARAVAVVLRDCPDSREAVSRRMGEFLGEECSPHMLDAYASQAKSEHTISALRLAALAHATTDVRAIQVLVEHTDHVIIQARYLGAVREAIIAAKVEELQAERVAARRSWKGGGR